MRKRCPTNRRRGATTVEFAICCPVVFFFCFATIVGGLGVFRYQQTAELAREAARWASVHGGQYEAETGNPAATANDIYVNAIEPMAATLNLSRLSYQVTWDKSNMPLSVLETSQVQGNKVTVKVTYQWFPEMFLVGPFTLTSTSTSQMVY
jgi:Flp pilus assembly protein TadG